MINKLIISLSLILITVSVNAGEWGKFSPELDTAVKQVLAGTLLSKKDWFDKTMSNQEELIKKYDLDKTSLISEFGEDMMIDHYLFSLKMSVILPRYHFGWPFHAAEINNIHRVLRNGLHDDSEPVYLAATILSAIRINEIRFAYTEYKKLSEKDKDWADYVAYYSFSFLGGIFSNGGEVGKPNQDIDKIE